MKYSLILISFIILAGCKSNSPSSPAPQKSIKYGPYIGSMLLTNNTGTDSSSAARYPIQFTFADSGWYTYANYFPSGAGSFQIVSDSVILTDKVAHIAIGDMTLILSGSFFLDTRTDSLILLQNDLKYRRYRYISLAFTN